MRRLGLEQDRAAARKPRRDQILHHLLLAVDRDDLARRQHRQIDVDDAAAEADVEPRVGHALAMQPLAGAEFVHQRDGALLQHAGAHAALDVVAAPRLQHDAVDAGAMQQQRQEQPGRTGADDPDLRAHSHFLSVPMLGAVEDSSNFQLVMIAVYFVDHNVRQTSYRPLIRSRRLPNMTHVWEATELARRFRESDRSLKSADRGRSFAIHACIRSRSSYAVSRMRTLMRGAAQSDLALLRE